MAKEIKATILFENGEKINLKLNPSAAPLSVKNFVNLAKSGYYDGLCFHRVIDNFMIQGGGLRWENGRLVPAPELAPIKGEFASNGVNNPLKHRLGVISMARTMIKDSATSQFFICVTDTPFLDGEYAAFGECADEESVNTAVRLGKVATRTLPSGYADVPVEPIVIKTVTAEE